MVGHHTIVKLATTRRTIVDIDCLGRGIVHEPLSQLDLAAQNPHFGNEPPNFQMYTNKAPISFFAGISARLSSASFKKRPGRISVFSFLGRRYIIDFTVREILYTDSCHYYLGFDRFNECLQASITGSSPL